MSEASVMVLNDVPYAEHKPDARLAQARSGACLQCAFAQDAVGCSMAVDGGAAAAFGGDCMARDVVYVYAEPRGGQA